MKLLWARFRELSCWYAQFILLVGGLIHTKESIFQFISSGYNGEVASNVFFNTLCTMKNTIMFFMLLFVEKDFIK